MEKKEFVSHVSNYLVRMTQLGDVIMGLTGYQY